MNGKGKQNRATEAQITCLRKLVNEGRSDAEIADEMKIPHHTIISWKESRGIGNKRRAKRMRLTIAQEIFKKSADHIATSERLIDELDRAMEVLCNMRQYTETRVGKKTVLSSADIRTIFDIQDQIVKLAARYVDLYNVHYNIASMHKFMKAFGESYRAMPIEYRKQFNENLEKNGIPSLGREYFAVREPEIHKN